jgi:putative transposase
MRLTGYDYSQAGAYFMTVCTQHRECLFGNVIDGVMVLNEAGRMVIDWYFEIESKYPVVYCDDYVVMPNHIHFVLFNVGDDLRVVPQFLAGEHTGSPLPTIIQWFKTMTTNAYIRGIKNQGWKPFNGKLWQRGYYDHIVRNEADLDRIREYIFNNPAQWAVGDNNPHKISLFEGRFSHV